MKTTSAALVTEFVSFGPNAGPLPECLPEMIRCRAYQIFEYRGSEPGHELGDWPQAEREIKTHLGLTNNKRPDAQAIRGGLSKPRLPVTRSTQFNANGGLTDFCRSGMLHVFIEPRRVSTVTPKSVWRWHDHCMHDQSNDCI
jgi:Protein of unknown function (DUF2934)